MAKIIKHIGTPRHSGRYRWGSGKNPQRSKDFVQNVKDLREKGVSDVEIAAGYNMKTTELRKRYRIESTARKVANQAMAIRLKQKGLSNPAIGKIMGGINESSVRGLLSPSAQKKAAALKELSDIIKTNVDKKKYIDIGVGIESQLGISRDMFLTSVKMLESKGYQVHKVEYQSGDKKFTKFLVLTDPKVTYKEVLANKANIKMIDDHFSEDGGKTFSKLEPIKSVDSSRIKVKYLEEGGKEKDGLIELRRGVDDLSLEGKRYAQVRIGVDGTHFMKGMAVYSDNIPDGYDIIYNSNKPFGTSKDKIFKPLEQKKELDGSKTGEIDLDNPFGSSVIQRHYIDKDGKKQLSAINRIGSGDKISEEGSWGEWRRTISSQVLSKQLPDLAKKQLKLSADIKQEEFDEINSLTNPAVKKILLKDFSETCDRAAVELKAHALPRQNTHVILPFSTIKENEVFAPNYNDGETVVLIRHPHGGIFEIPQLRVNNKNREALKTLGTKPSDAVGINPKTATKLSGADFDGDTVLVIPNNSGAIKTKPAFKDLIEFDAKSSYPLPPGSPKMSDIAKGLRMGDVSNLITDMTIKGAPEREIIRAVKHSMVVIDAQKHDLDYKKSAIDFNIAELKERYQGSSHAGAATIISRAKSKEYRPERKPINLFGRKNIDPKTGKIVYEETGKTFVSQKYKIDKETGKKVYLNEYEIKPRMTVTTKMAEYDPYSLSSGTRMENIYADYATKLKSLANQARLKLLDTPNVVYSPSASKVYAKEVDRLNSAARLAVKNKPYERHAQLLAATNIANKRRGTPNMDNKTLKKLRGMEIEKARARMGAKKLKFELSDREWEAIQAGAISNSKLMEILKNVDTKELKQRALPKNYIGMSPTKLARAKSMLASGHTPAEIASSLGVSTSTLNKALEKG